jgi:hypothetical protein
MISADGRSDGGALGREAARRVRSDGGIEVRPGLTDRELDAVERRYGFEFADDHRAFLAAGLPAGPGWPDWRDGDPADLRRRLDRPVEGVLFDVEHNGYWHPGWGPPPRRADVVDAAREHLATVPQLVPVYSHRYLPGGRGTWGHPVLSVSQTDVIFYGLDLADYIDAELTGRELVRWDREPRATVPFWRDLV